MKQIKLKGYTLAIFIVEGNALHITVRNAPGKMNIEHFNTAVPVLLKIVNEFSKEFKKLPQSWSERIIKNNTDQTKQVIILILK